MVGCVTKFKVYLTLCLIGEDEGYASGQIILNMQCLFNFDCFPKLRDL